MVFAPKVWRHFHFGETCEIFMDHESLKCLFSQKELNMRQKKLIELLKNCIIQYHPRKRSVVVDALRKKSIGFLETISVGYKRLLGFEVFIGLYQSFGLRSLCGKFHSTTRLSWEREN